ncbi:hypothetical protein SLS64_007812 [Diaporthe eres]|uniref:Lytic polysaccharide monooxygenase n=1 Tax=Diaporthe eres TaxID=83184 RepID=A0ABR1P640_DIAER
MIALLVAMMAARVEPHMIMATPKPYGNPDNSPLTSSNYPCKVTSDPATFYKTDGIIDQNSMVAGENQTLSFTPSAETSWRVLMSIESGCPSKDGSGPSTYDFTIPADLTPGQYSFAWTWISKLAGQPEYYMNCAPITVTAGKTKRDNEGVSLLPRDDSYPELFVGNLADINSCKSTPSTDPEYPDPGTNVEKLGASPSFASISGSNCVPKGLKEGAGSLPTATAGNSGGAAAGNTQAASASATASSAAGQQSSSQAAGSPSGGVFATTGGGAAGSAASPTTLVTSTSAPQASSVYVSPVTPAPAASSTSSSDDSSSATDSASVSAPPAASDSSSASAPASTPAETSASASSATKPAPSATLSPSGGGSGSGNSTGSDGGSSGKSGACTSEGMFNCIGTKYQQCASGAWTAMQALPGGTTCQQGESENLWARDTTRSNRVRRFRWGGKRWMTQDA